MFENRPNFAVLGDLKGKILKMNVEKPPRKSISTETRHPVQKKYGDALKNVFSRAWQKILKREKITHFWTLYFTPFPRLPCWADWYYFWHVGSQRRLNHRSQILSRLIQKFGGYGCPKSRVVHWHWYLRVAFATVLRSTVTSTSDELFSDVNIDDFEWL